MLKLLKLFTIMLFALITTIIINDKAKAFNDIQDQKMLKVGVVQQQFSARNYVLGPNDVISVDVCDNPEYKQDSIHVRPDGKITLVPLGTINVAGLTVEDLNNLLVQKYKFYLNNPLINIKLERPRPFQFYITGAVLNPGSYQINTDTNSYLAQNIQSGTQGQTPLLTNLLISAGGISYDADLENVEISNKIENKSYKINLLDLLENGNTDQDLYLISGDSIYIPKLPSPLAISEEKYKLYAKASFCPKTIPVKVYGYVNNPGLISLNVAQSLNLNSAIMAAGGYLKDAAYAPSKVIISRADNNGKLVAKTINPKTYDSIILPNDIIYVPSNSRPIVGRFFDFANRILLPAQVYTNVYKSW